MAYTATTILPSNIRFFQWSLPDAAKPALVAGISASATTLYWNYAPKDKDGNVITDPFVVGIERADGYVESVYCPSGADGAGGLSSTGCVRGVRLEGLDYTTGDSSLAVSHLRGEKVFCNVTGVWEAILLSTLQGAISTGAVNFKIGGGLDQDVKIVVDNGDANPPFMLYDSGASAWYYSNDGTNELPYGGAGAVTGGEGTVIIAGAINVNLADTDIFSDDGVGERAIVSKADGKLAKEFLDIGDGLEFVTDTLEVKLKSGGGISKDSDGLYQDTAIYQTATFTALEAITADQAVALLPNEVQWYSQLTGVNLALGDANARRARYIKFTPTTDGTMTDFKFRAAEAVNGATALGNLVITFETDNAGEPSGTVVSGGTETISQATQRTWTASQGTRTATWDSPVSYTGGVTYYIVFTCSATNATNYLNIGCNSSYDENYVTFETGIFDLDTGTWGNTATNATPFFWGSTESVPFGYGLVPTDANWGGRTWNFLGFAKANAAAAASVDVYIDVVPDLSGLSAAPSEPYYLSATPGEITTTIPTGRYGSGTFCYKIGIALDGTTFQIERGEKRIWGTFTESATATEQVITWFKMREFEIRGGSFSNGTELRTTVKGVYDGTSNYNISTLADDGGTDSVEIVSTLSFGITSGTYRWQGVGSAVTDVGLTYTLTKFSTAGDVQVLWEVKG